MKKLIIFVIGYLFCFPLYSQNWVGVGSGADDVISCLFNDTINHKLCIAGDFRTINGGNARGIATWDETSFDSMSVGVNYMYGSIPVSIESMCNYQGKLYVGGKMDRMGYVNAKGIAIWDGSNWDSLSQPLLGGVFDLLVDSGYLYACGVIVKAGGISVNSIAKWDGTNWSNIGAGFPYSGSIACMKLYSGELYVGGNFEDSTGHTMNVAKFDGTNWKSAGINILGSISDIKCMEVYNSELYIGGLFTTSDGNLDNGIMRYDGTTWKAVGGGFTETDPVEKLKVINSELYATGVFYTAGGVPATMIAKWDGTNWCSLGSRINGGIYAIEEYNNKMYIGGGFDSIDLAGGPYNAMLAKWVGGTYVDSCGHLLTGIDESHIDNESLNIYPNPATNQITIEFDLAETKNTSIEIKNVLGQSIKTIASTFTKGTNKIEMDVSDLSSGLYFIQLQSGNKMISKKFIKQ